MKGKMEGLMLICSNLGEEVCHPDIRKLEHPTKEKVRKLDKICKKCKSRLFEIDKKECPVCDNEDIQWKGARRIEYELGSIEGNFYRCNKCKTQLIAEKKF